jgi:hypothetical protein
MARVTDVATFNSKAFEETVSTMRARREAVHDKGETIYRTTGRLDPNVDVKGKQRVSRNSMVPGTEAGTFVLPNGIALPILSQFDGTGSMAENVEKAFEAIPVLDTMLSGIRTRYNTQIASAVVQDVGDGHPVFQMSQFESDNRIAEQMRLLVPDRSGGDAPEDYDLGLAYLLLATRMDIFDFYGLRGYTFIVGDQIGRGQVRPGAVKDHLGHTLQSSMETRDICRQLLQKWHLFYIQVGSGGGATHNSATTWWQDKLGSNRVVLVPNPDLLAEVQAGLIYVTETEQPTPEGFEAFITSNGENKRVSAREAREVWKWLTSAGVPFGLQAKLPGFNAIPKPGDIFANYRHAWPIGHPKAGEQPVVSETDDAPTTILPATKKPIDWSKF